METSTWTRLRSVSTRGRYSDSVRVRGGGVSAHEDKCWDHSLSFRKQRNKASHSMQESEVMSLTACWHSGGPRTTEKIPGMNMGSEGMLQSLDGGEVHMVGKRGQQRLVVFKNKECYNSH